MKKIHKKELTGRDFDAMSAAEKERIYHEIDSKTTGQLLAESKPLTAAQKARWNRFKKKMGRGRPKIGEGSQPVTITLEKGLLKRTDAYARRHGLKRAELVSLALQRIIGTGGKSTAA